MPDATPAERGWFFRRTFTYAGTALNLACVAVILFKLDDPSALKWIGLGLLTNNLVLASFYLAGASIMEWAQVAAGWRSGKAPKEEDKPDGV